MCMVTKDIACTVAYMVGVPVDMLYTNYGVCYERVNELKNNNEATVIRMLNIIKTQLMMTFKRTDYALRYNMATFDTMEWFADDVMSFLKKNEINIYVPNGAATDYMTFINQQINTNIEACAGLFPDWVKWEYIKGLFTHVGWDVKSIQKREFTLYQANRDVYPHRMYIHWNPISVGDLLADDVKFLNILYKQHKDKFEMTGRCKDIDTDTRVTLYDFINAEKPVDIVVDCENSNVFKLYAMLNSMDKRVLNNINKILLFDDMHTTVGWQYLEQHITIPVEYIDVARVKNEKSLVDMRVAMGISREHYKNGVNSFILVASDSDYWGVISALSDVKFYCITEDDKIGHLMLDMLDKHNIEHCTLDDFNTEGADALKASVLLDELRHYACENNVVGMNVEDLAYILYANTRITATKNEIIQFCDTYLSNVKICVDKKTGVFTLED